MPSPAEPDRGEDRCARLDTPQPADPAARVFPIINKRGLHARASARFVETVEDYDSEVTIVRDGMSVGGLSIMGLLMLAASQGTTIEVSATGPDAVAVLDALEALIANRFGEDG
ncbi:HPr family phosphocarrier protein [Jiella sp. MQZ9-1]|uniref:HPr family phosphocarrier protein n=1 Tax=Jiella flava TaxID=2816857 RepID=A0A939JUQ7_9HYPH|nr:HPr family phosphocarrier protein [Jiella flava]MBO0661669.1 HPr family phosphocarrier protein [Jiella flava]MCD2470311.1 HPr family phosphocarrier protein [Jiella flava]